MASSVAVCSITSSRGISTVGLRQADQRKSTGACRASATNSSVPLKTHQHSSDATTRRQALLTSAAALSLAVPEVTALLNPAVARADVESSETPAVKSEQACRSKLRIVTYWMLGMPCLSIKQWPTRVFIRIQSPSYVLMRCVTDDMSSLECHLAHVWLSVHPSVLAGQAPEFKDYENLDDKYAFIVPTGNACFLQTLQAEQGLQRTRLQAFDESYIRLTREAKH